ncbi:unnamed protein product [Symbiodinium sp. CCMP2592]|nr:unnamed protein product [Symbiodinium sp. CCMP2592]
MLRENRKPKKKASIADWSYGLEAQDTKKQQEQPQSPEEKPEKRDRSKRNKFNFLMVVLSVAQKRPEVAGKAMTKKVGHEEKEDQEEKKEQAWVEELDRSNPLAAKASGCDHLGSRIRTNWISVLTTSTSAVGIGGLAWASAELFAMRCEQRTGDFAENSLASWLFSWGPQEEHMAWLMLRTQSGCRTNKAILLLEELDEAADASGGKGSGPRLDALGKHAVGALSSTLDALSLNLMNLTQDLGDWTQNSSEKEPKGGKGAVAQMLDFLLPDMDQEVEEKKVCPEGWERVLGDVYGGDQFSGGWRHSAESVEDCAWKCLTQPGCGSFEWSESRKRCFRNSQTRPTHEADRAGFVFCRRQPCPSFKTHKDCVGPGVSPGFYSKEVRMRPGSYCIWSGGACQAPMACTDSDCFLPDGGLPGMDLPSRYTLWISREGLQASMASATSAASGRL